MPTGNDKFRAAGDEASCAFLASAGGAAASVAAYSLLTGNLVVGGLAAATTGIAVYAYGKGCQWDTSGAEYPTDVTLECCPPLINPSTKEEQWAFRVFRLVTQTWITIEIGYSGTVNGQYNRGWIDFPTVQGGDGEWRLEPCGVSFDRRGTLPASYFDPGLFRDLHIVPPINTGCDGPEAPLPDPYVYTDPDDGCQIQVTMLGWGVDAAGNYTPVWQMEPAPQSAAVRASGGIIGGCNFTPIIYYDGPDGPVLPPVPPDPIPGPDGEPWWLAPLLGALGGATALVIDKALDELFQTPIPQWSFTMRAACEFKQDGTYEDYTITLPQANYQERMLQLAETQLDFLQQHLLWKTPTCGGNLPGQTGTPYTINWVSDELDSHGRSLRKEFRYFDQTGKDLGEHFQHWKDFTWQAGPIFVGTSGTPLGKTHVWAESEAEGRRVIEHAASIAGVTLPDDSWGISVASGGRIGKPGTMRLQRSDGRYWISTRSSPSGPPTYPVA